MLQPAVVVTVPIMAVVLWTRTPWALMAALFVNSLCRLPVTVTVAAVRQRIVPLEWAGRLSRASARGARR